MMTALEREIRTLYQDDAQVADVVSILFELLLRIEKLEEAAAEQQGAGK